MKNLYEASRWLFAVFVASAIPCGLANDLTQNQGVIFSATETERVASTVLRGEIQGPYWVPSGVDIQHLKRALNSYLKQQADGSSRELASHFAEYRMQYLGYTDHGKRYIFVNGFCKNFWQTNNTWKSDFVAIFDGGDCYFRARYGVTEAKIVDFVVNGES